MYIHRSNNVVQFINICHQFIVGEEITFEILTTFSLNNVFHRGIKKNWISFSKFPTLNHLFHRAIEKNLVLFSNSYKSSNFTETFFLNYMYILLGQHGQLVIKKKIHVKITKQLFNIHVQCISESRTRQLQHKFIIKYKQNIYCKIIYLYKNNFADHDIYTVKASIKVQRGLSGQGSLKHRLTDHSSSFKLFTRFRVYFLQSIINLH